MSSEVLDEEFEVLESIYPTELTKLSEREIQIEVDPEGDIEGEEPLKSVLKVTFPEGYPDVAPDLALEIAEGELDEAEVDSLLDDLRTTAEESLGVAMTFTLVSRLQEQIYNVISARVKRRQQEELEKERRALEEEEAKTRGTPVTAESFAEWNARFLKELTRKQAKEEDEKLKGLSAKDRDEYRKIAVRLTGRQLFERDRNLDTSDASLLEEGTVSVDFSQYDRTQAEEEDEEEEHIAFSDSD